MSKIRKSKIFLKKTRCTHFVTRMLSFSIFDRKKRDDKIFIFLRKKLKNIINGNIMATFSNILATKTGKNGQNNYYCEVCDYICSKKYHLDRHLTTSKHIKSTQINVLASKTGKNGQTGQTEQNEQNEKMYNCQHCNKQYSDRSGLWRHRKKCFDQKQTPQNNITNDQFHLFTDVIKTTVIEVMKNGMVNNTNSNNNSNNNSHNKTFNLSFYLNETCKDAINIGDFVKSVKVQLEDLENTGRQGYVEGITNIVVNNLNSITTHQRPIHCTDEKREIIYIKNEGEWIKEADNKPILTNAIKTIANENIKAISQWKNKYPDCIDVDSKKNNLYLKIVSNSMSGGSKEECEKNYNKIIKNIVKETIINKDIC